MQGASPQGSGGFSAHFFLLSPFFFLCNRGPLGFLPGKFCIRLIPRFPCVTIEPPTPPTPRGSVVQNRVLIAVLVFFPFL